MRVAYRFMFRKIRNSFPYCRFCWKTRFETEAQYNSAKAKRFVFSTVADKCRRILFNVPIQHKALTGRLIRTVETLNPGSCQVKCYNEPNCVSINVGPLDRGRHKCELNNDTVENQASSFLQTRKDYTFFGIEVRCLIARVKNC